MHIKKENITIRSAQNRDAEVLTAWWNDGKVMAHAGFPEGLNIELSKVEAQIEKNKERLSQLCIIEIDKQRVGECNYRLKDDYAEIGIKICDFIYQNKGLGTQILQMLIDYIFTDDDINRKAKVSKIVLNTNLKNKRAQHVYEKIGFKKVGVKIDAWENQIGELCSLVDYELTYDDFTNKKTQV